MIPVLKRLACGHLHHSRRGQHGAPQMAICVKVAKKPVIGLAPTKTSTTARCATTRWLWAMPQFIRTNKADAKWRSALLLKPSILRSHGRVAVSLGHEASAAREEIL